MRGASLFFLLIAATLDPAWGQNAPDDAELEKIDAAIERVQSTIRETRSEHQAVESRLQQTEQRISRLSSAVDDLEARIAGEEQRLESIQQQTGELEREKSRQQAVVASYIRAAYTAGREEYLKLLLNQEDPAGIGRTLEYYRYFTRARTGKIEGYQRLLADLADLREQSRLSRDRLESDRRELAENLDALEQEQARRRRILAELDDLLDESGAELTRLRREREQMELLIEELNRSIADLPLGVEQVSFADMKGKLPWPVDGPLLNRYGTRHELGDLDWQGVTIDVEAGDEVRAVHHGRVIFADWFGRSGLLLIIDHGDGYMSLYAHNQQLYKEVGDWVSSGEPIAAAGDTGGRSAEGVYFEIRHNGRSQDPAVWCLARQ